jgi:RNA polymerase sigma-70 factor (ECF subfamily)
MALAYRILGERAAAEDAVQESFLAAWRRAESWDPCRGDPRRWLLSIVHHRCIDRLRRVAVGGPTTELDESLPDTHAPDVFYAANLSVQRDAIRAALASIPAEQRQAIELAYFGGRTQQEIAALQGVPLGTVKGRLRIGLQKLRTLLEPAVRMD